MEEAWQGLLFTPSPDPPISRFAGNFSMDHGTKNLLGKSVIWSRKVSHGGCRGTCNFEKYIQHDNMILYLAKRKNNRVSVENQP